ncbi:lactate racemase domain-containing protein [Pararhizobium haloflavum]|uniref:lactate racemase domain-containing protein n=1 Tax=Pararhizobium haloflavum TaxID=2037914 RepID=UPI000C1A2DE8|nr:lactate racemase domain-containing protein [Pararhizobium haloflavum]
MTTKRIAVDYGDRKIDIDVPNEAVVVEYEDPPLLENPEEAILAALRNPLDSPPLADLARPGMKVAIGFDDITRPNLPPRTILPIIVDELNRAGVPDRDILLINACSNHRKNTRSELANHLGPAIFNRFWRSGQIRNHDCADQEGLIYFGVTESGRHVEHNRDFMEADLQIYQGNVSAQPWRGFTGTGVIVGLASTRSIASHHSFNTIPDPMRKSRKTGAKKVGMKEEMTAFLEEATGKKTFYVNAVTATGGRFINVFAGSAGAVSAPAWELATKSVSRKVPQADVLIVGLPPAYSYGSSDNTLIAAVGALVPPRYSPAGPVLREGGVVIAMSPSRGQIDLARYPSYQDAADLYARCHRVREMVDHEAEFDARPQYRHPYHDGFGYPPLHAFWLFYELEYTLDRAGAVVMAGTTNPGAFRSLGITPTTDFESAWKIAERHCGKNPVTVVAPTFWSRPRIKFIVEE